MKEPRAHTLYEEQKKLWSECFACFMKSESIANKSSKELKEIDVTKNNVKQIDIFVGHATRVIINESRSPKSDPFVKEFFDRTIQAYHECGSYLQKKIALNK